MSMNALFSQLLMLKANGTDVSVFFCTACQMLCLQVELRDDTDGNSASDVSNRSRDVVNNSDMPPVKQVNTFVSGGF